MFYPGRTIGPSWTELPDRYGNFPPAVGFTGIGRSSKSGKIASLVEKVLENQTNQIANFTGFARPSRSGEIASFVNSASLAKIHKIGHFTRIRQVSFADKTAPFAAFAAKSGTSTLNGMLLRQMAHQKYTK